MTVHLWRVASDTPSWTADDMSGKGAASNVRAGIIQGSW